jgi:hypothetical protein
MVQSGTAESMKLKCAELKSESAVSLISYEH